MQRENWYWLDKKTRAQRTVGREGPSIETSNVLLILKKLDMQYFCGISSEF